ncbi:MAG: UDPGP type 1 family protein [Kiritimatiellaeota bacterium]|nr:UDPGP type 1 family protein [Kiritimatiellota bacterium]
MTEPHINKAELVARLRPWGQEHLLRFWDGLSAGERMRLAGQIQAVDWAQMDRWIRRYVLQKPEVSLPPDLEPAPYYPLEPEDGRQRELYARARKHGAALLSAGRVAGFTVAGGQGTRLGFDAPKGTFRIAPVTGKSLFQLFAEGILRAREKYGAPIPWYVMTSPINDAATRAFFQAAGYFGLPETDVRFFPQGTLPAVGFDGKLLLARRDSMALSPNGHGGSLAALRDSGALEEMRARGVDHISYWQVDNPLVRTFDPLFLGLHDLLGSDMSSRALIKTGPFEKLGNFCVSSGTLQIIEYSDMPKDLATAVGPDGRLRFRAGSPAIHILRRSFVEHMTEGEVRLPLHRAEKKVSCVDADGNTVQPVAPNAVKLEMFIFDALPEARAPIVLEMARGEQFGPVKNPDGVDSVVSCRALMVERAARWLEAAGIQVPRESDGRPACLVELSPRRYLDPEDVKANAARITPPRPGEAKAYE